MRKYGRKLHPKFDHTFIIDFADLVSCYLLLVTCPKGQLILKTNCQAVNSSKKRTNEFVFTGEGSCRSSLIMLHASFRLA